MKFCALVTLVLALATTAVAGIHNLANDWSDAVNPNGPWTLLKSPTTPFAVNQPNWYNNAWLQHAWADTNTTQLQHVPAWIKGTVPPAELGLDAPIGQVYMHGAETDRTGTDTTIARWTSNFTGTATISGTLWNLRHIGRTMAWQLRRNGSTVSSGIITSADSYSSVDPFNMASGSGGPGALSQLVVPGTTIDLVFISTPSNLGDFVGMNFEIQTPVPRRVTGVASLADFTRSLEGEKLTCEVWKDGVLIQKPYAIIGVGGAYALDPTPDGACTLKFRCRSSLIKSVNVNLGPTPIVANVSLVNGDVDNSGEVDAVDIDLVIADFGSLDGANADVDGSFEVDAVDIDLVIANFGNVDD